MKELMKLYGRGLVLGAGILTAVTVGLWVVYGQDIFQVEKDGTPRFKVTADGKIPVGSTGSYENLVIQNNSTEPTDKVDITANAITIEGVRLENLSVSATITTTGAGGLDVAGTFTNTWYYVWTITNNDGTASNGLLTRAGSASEFNPVLPSGYTKKRRVGAVRNDASSNFLKFAQEGNRVLYDESQAVLTNGVATTYTDVSCAVFIPPTSRQGIFWNKLSPKHSGAGIAFNSNVRTNGSSGNGLLVLGARVNAASDREIDTLIGEMITDASQLVEYKIDFVPDEAGGVQLNVLGYYERI